MWQKTLLKSVLVTTMSLGTVACGAMETAQAPDDTAMDPPVLSVGETPRLQQMLAALPDDRIVFVGESHTRYDHHLVQLEVLKFLHRRHGDVALGVEWFQTPAQPALDDYLAGRITEAQMLDRSGYFDRWRFDYRLYRPIIEYAKHNGIPIIALNAPVELTRKIGQDGLGALPADERATLPAEYGPVKEGYRTRVKAAFDAHPPQGQSFDHFFEVMQTWDETMAQRAADHLAAHPGRRMVVLAGSGHVMYGDGIPDRLERRTGIRGTRLLVGAELVGEADVADFIVLSREQVLPPAGKLGAFLDTTGDSVKVQGLVDDSPLKPVGVGEGDVIVAIDGIPTPTFADLKLALLDKAPGDKVTVRYRSAGWLSGEDEDSVEIALGGETPPMMHR
ncbi:ChaN family lipoprotein [Nitrogeniibacter aestuarii]|uniref:ChaN family lipoprotein n=2 Tax=Nitrogeniibacter aestuarii TaxID=2815343 RepID=UPI001D12285B|nr:ChaN family lipoprotein [Nitrogeniibacter aestuarii]